METAELADLIRRAQRRDPAAFDALVEAYNARLYGYFYRLTGSRHDAEDLLQEVFVRLVRMIDQYEHKDRFDGWLFRVATNLARDRVRRARRTAGLHAQAVSAEVGPLDELADPAVDQPGRTVERAEQCDRLQWALGQLPEAERQVILLRHFSQMAFREIAEVMDTPLGTALARAHRGLARLRKMMTAGDDRGDYHGDTETRRE